MLSVQTRTWEDNLQYLRLQCNEQSVWIMAFGVMAVNLLGEYLYSNQAFAGMQFETFITSITCNNLET